MWHARPMTDLPHPSTRGRSVRRWAGALAASALLITAACSGDDGDGAAPATTAPSTTTTAAPSTTAPSTTVVTAPAPAEPLSWQQVDAGPVTPPPRSGAVLVASPDGVLWLHGGQVDGEPMGDLWRFGGTEWQEVTFEGGPSPRSEHAAVWDAAGDRLVVALGEGSGGEVFDDVWAFDLATSTWSTLATGGPAARYGQCTVVDDQGRMVISHGFSSSERFGDTWAFDLAAATWADMTPAEGPRPSNRCLHACGYHEATGEVVLFVGRNDDEPYLGDTWRLGAGGWQEVPGVGPSPRSRSRAAFTDGLLVFGGEGADGLAGDAWLLGEGGWVPGPTGGPDDRQAPAVAEVDGVVWVVGGLGEDGPLADLWRYG